MVQYVDTGALLKRYVAEPDSDLAERLLQEDPDWLATAHTEIEVRRTLARDPASLKGARKQFLDDWSSVHVVALDPRTCEQAATLARDLTPRRPVPARSTLCTSPPRSGPVHPSCAGRCTRPARSRLRRSPRAGRLRSRLDGGRRLTAPGRRRPTARGHQG
jgi:predicted nucleic acid-binding protein